MAVYGKASKTLFFLSFSRVHTEKKEKFKILEKVEWMVFKKYIANYVFF